MDGGGSTPCVSPWCGEKCELLNCDETDCNGNGVCTNGSCKCKAGWYDSLCEILIHIIDMVLVVNTLVIVMIMEYVIM
uniref:EGF-like domain-containing protein n=1 Tax=Amphimedon queenslandica TaxID=400682 RepID=A0A1X7T2G1_AMPQE